MGAPYTINGVVYFIRSSRVWDVRAMFFGIISLIPMLENKLRINWLKIYFLRSPVAYICSSSLVNEVIWISRSIRKACLGHTLLLISEK